MARHIYLILIVVFSFISVDSYSQIIIENVYNGKQIEINTNDRIKVVFETDRHFNGLYAFILHGRNKDFKTGKLMSFNDSIIVVKSGLLGKKDTIQVNDIQAINRFNPFVRGGFYVVTNAAILLVLISTSIVDSPFIVGCYALGICGTTIADDLIIYPYKSKKKKKWQIEVK